VFELSLHRQDSFVVIISFTLEEWMHKSVYLGEGVFVDTLEFLRINRSRAKSTLSTSLFLIKDTG
jgi:hypothetical protein